jgi:hypothetical protein
VAAVPAVIFGISTLSRGDDLSAVVPSMAGIVLGRLLGWGAVHSVNRRPTDFFLFYGMVGGLEVRAFHDSTGAFVGSFVPAVVVMSVLAMLLRLPYFMRKPYFNRLSLAKPAATPRSAHALYDAEIDGASRSAR